MVHDRGGKSDIGKSRDRGSREAKHHQAHKEGEIMLVAERNVVSTHPMNSIRNVAKLMEENDFRRIPVTDAGTERLDGMAVAINILDFLGGGEKYNIIERDYNGNFLSAINCPIKKIMRKEQPFLDKGDSVEEAVKIMVSKRTSAIPIVDNDDNKKFIAIVTERDILPVADEFGIAVRDAMRERCITSSLGMMLSDVSKAMVRSKLRRLPVIQEDRLIGIVTVFDVLRFLGYGEFHGIEADDVLSDRVERIMERNVVTVSPEQDLGVVSKMVKETNIGGFPVVENDRLVGIITTTDIIREIYGRR